MGRFWTLREALDSFEITKELESKGFNVFDDEKDAWIGITKGELYISRGMAATFYIVDNVIRSTYSDSTRIELHIVEDKEESSDRIENDPVNHPSHYTNHPTGVECIDIIEWFPANIANAVKYLWRHGLKGGEADAIQDLRKAAWYANREADRLEKMAKKEAK